jgi:hypothetical protein
MGRKHREVSVEDKEWKFYDDLTNVRSPQFNQATTDLKTWLDDLTTQGKFAYSRQRDLHLNPVLHITGHGLVPLPLTARDAEKIKTIAAQQLAGRRSGSPVDKEANDEAGTQPPDEASSRRGIRESNAAEIETTLQTSTSPALDLSGDQFQLCNPGWHAFAMTVAYDAISGLGIPPAEVDIRLDKLVLFEGRAVSIDDKTDGSPAAVGTLLICLQSQHEGGKITVHHLNQTKELETSHGSSYALTTLSWCEGAVLEMMPLSSGYRLALSYELIPRPNSYAFRTNDFNDIQRARLQDLFLRFHARFPKIHKLIYILDELYEEQPLTISSLVGRDQVVLQTLMDVCKACGWFLFLGNLKRFASDGDSYWLRNEEDAVWTRLENVASAGGYDFAESIGLNVDEVIGGDPYNRQDYIGTATDGDDQWLVDENEQDTVWCSFSFGQGRTVANTCNITGHHHCPESKFGRGVHLKTLLFERRSHGPSSFPRDNELAG